MRSETEKYDCPWQSASARKVEKVEKSRKFEADAFVLFPEK